MPRPGLFAPALLLILLAPTLTGCTAQRELIDRQQRTIDSLRTENAVLHDRTATLADSLQFYDDVESGAYYRQMRTLRDRLTRLTYETSLLRDRGITVATLQADALFEPASATLRQHGIDQLVEIAEDLQSTYPQRQIRVEGHADNVPLGPSLQEVYPSNWELSAARAAAVARHLIDTHEVNPDRFGILGFGSTRPVADNDTAAGRWLNRRVRIAVLPEPSNIDRPTELSW
jgi:chemotaxis protein MotB